MWKKTSHKIGPPVHQNRLYTVLPETVNTYISVWYLQLGYWMPREGRKKNRELKLKQTWLSPLEDGSWRIDDEDKEWRGRCRRKRADVDRRGGVRCRWVSLAAFINRFRIYFLHWHMSPLPMIKFKERNVVIAAASVRRLCLSWTNASTPLCLKA